jgi:hypothetical protein
MCKRLIPLLLLVVATPLSAQENPVFPRFSVSGALYQGEFTTDVRVNEEGLEGTAIGLERDLGLDDSAGLQRFSLQWRPFNRHELALSHFSSEREGFEEIDREIVFRGTTYPVRADVTTRFDAELWDVTYTYWMRKRERDGIGLMLGVSGISLDAAIDAQAPNGSVTVTQDAKTDVPVAVIGVQGRWALSDRVLFEANAAALPRVQLDVYSGRATRAAARIEYRVTPWLGLGAGYNYFRIDGTVDELDFTGELSMTIRGAEGFVRLAF